MEMIENAQNKGGFFDENMFISDWEKIQEIRITDFIFAYINYFKD